MRREENGKKQDSAQSRWSMTARENAQTRQQQNAGRAWQSSVLVDRSENVRLVQLMIDFCFMFYSLSFEIWNSFHGTIEILLSSRWTIYMRVR